MILWPEQIDPEIPATNVDWVGMEVLNKLQIQTRDVPIARQVGTKMWQGSMPRT
jgi:hypothetical protein